MTPDQLKELERLNERWANEYPNKIGDSSIHIATDVMDLLPDVLTHIKELTAERDALSANLKMKEEFLHEWKRTAESLKESVPAANRLCRELEQLKAERDAAQKACAELNECVTEWANEGFIVINPNNDPRTDHGKGWLSPEQANEYRTGVMRELRRIAREEWKPVLNVLEDIATDDLDRESGGVKQSAQQALAHAEKLMEGK